MSGKLLLSDLQEPKAGPKAAELWHARLERAVEFRDKHWNGIKSWKAANRLVRGDHWTDKKDPDAISSDEPDDRVKVNLAGSISSDFEAYLMRRTPIFHGDAAENAEDQTFAEGQGHLLNYFWKEQRMQKQAKRAVRDMINIGHGIIRTGWIQELEETLNPDKDGFINYSEAIKKEMPIIKRVSPFRFVWDEFASEYDLESARWSAEMYMMPLADMLRSRKYNGDKAGAKLIARIRSGEIQPKFYVAADDKNREAVRSVAPNDEEFDDDLIGQNLVVIYDVWDKKHKANFHILAGVNEDFLFYQKWPYDYLDGFPFIMGVYIEMNDIHFPRGLMIDLQDQQHELNRIRTAEFQHRRKLGRSMYMVTEALPDSEKTKLRTGKDGEVITVPHMAAIQAVPTPTLPAEAYRMEEIIKEDMRQLSGQNAMMAGSALPSRTSAAEVNKRASYSDIKLEDRIIAVDDMILRVGEQILAHTKANMKKPKIVHIIGPWGNDWPEMTPEQIAVQADLRLTSTSTPVGDTDQAKSTADQLMTTIMNQLPLLNQMGIELNLTEMFKWWFAKHGAEKEAGRFFPGISDPPGPQLPDPANAEAAGPQAPPGAPPNIPADQVTAQQEGVQPQSLAQGAQGSNNGQV